MEILSEAVRSAIKGTIIEDELLEPFFIVQYVDGGYAIMRKTLSNSGEVKARILSYPSSFSGCLYKIAMERLHNENGYASIQEYIQTWKEITDQFRQVYKTSWNVEKI